jgi:hypothetical protein
MAFRKIEMNNGAPISVWDVSHIGSYDPVAKRAVICVAGYFDDAARQSGSVFKTHEFLVENTQKIKQDTRPATVSEKKEAMPSALIENMTDEQIEEMSHDIVVKESIVDLPYFDNFSKMYEKGKWRDAANAYLKSDADHLHGFFRDAVEID